MGSLNLAKYIFLAARPRRWITELDNYLPEEKRKELKDAADEAGVQMVRKTVDAEGRTRVCKTQFGIHGNLFYKPYLMFTIFGP